VNRKRHVGPQAIPIVEIGGNNRQYRQAVFLTTVPANATCACDARALMRRSPAIRCPRCATRHAAASEQFEVAPGDEPLDAFVNRVGLAAVLAPRLDDRLAHIGVEALRLATRRQQADFTIAPGPIAVANLHVRVGTVEGKPLVGFPRLWKKLFKDTALANITPQVLRHSFSSVANDLGFTEATIGALMGHSRGTVTGRYIHTVDSLLVMAADTVAGYIKALLDGKKCRRTTYALDRASREATLARLFEQSVPLATEERLAA